MTNPDYERQATAVANLRQSTAQRRHAESELQLATKYQAGDIRMAFAAGAPLRTLTDITGLSAARLYQIRDEGVKFDA